MVVESVVIIGAGICGLLTAQGLKKAGIPFTIYEKETSAGRSRDWGMAYFWSADYLPYLLPPEMVARLQEAQVDPWYTVQPVETMTVTNGKDGSAIKFVPSPGGRRVGRKALRKLLAEGIDIRYGHTLETIDFPDASSVIATFTNGHSSRGSLLLGSDGGGSAVRRHLLGSTLAAPKSVPIYMVNINVRYRNPGHAVFIRSKARHFVDHGVHPKGMFFLITLQSVPDPGRPETWSFQLTITWPPDLSPDKENPEPPHTLQDLRELTKDWASPKREAIEWLSESEVTVTNGFFGPNGEHSTSVEHDEDDPYKLVIPSDRVSVWPPVPWNNRGGRVTLAGDAAHAMTFHRGQGLNNCIRDARELVTQIERCRDGMLSLSAVIEEYEREMLDRGSAEVQKSMEQTLMCHNWETFQQSPVMKIGGSPIRPVDNHDWMNILAEQTQVI